MNKVELLAPVGKLENAYAAVENGADALFAGGVLFNARQYANNLTYEELEELVKYCRLRGVKIYITLNILIKQSEIDAVFDYLSYLDRLGIHGVIVQDIGVANIIKKYFPRMSLHASTQMTAHSLKDVVFLKEFGFKRVVLARELSLAEILQIRTDCDVELETFIHGALCYSYSGQCLLSSFIGGRSGNRGRCAQPCRMNYSLLENGKSLVSDKCLLSLKDMNTIEILPKLIESGITSFKIEGRMKSPEYVASVTRIYRKYIDRYLENPSQKYKVEDKDLEELLTIFNRGGFSKGYYFQNKGIDMVTPHSPKDIGLEIGKVVAYNHKSKLATILTHKGLNPGDGIEVIDSRLRSEGAGISKKYNPESTFQVKLEKISEINSKVYLSKNHLLLKELKKSYSRSIRKLPIEVLIEGKKDRPLILSMNYGEISVTEKGDILEEATSAPITQDEAIKQLTKLGNTPFLADHVVSKWDENIYLPISKLNEVRRKTTEKFERELLKVSTADNTIEYSKPIFINKNENLFSCHVRSMEQLEECIKYEKVARIYWEWNYSSDTSKKALELCKKYKKAFYLVLPYIFRNNLYNKYEKELLTFETTDMEGYLIRTYGQFQLLKESIKKKQMDFSLNIMNDESADAWKKLGASGVTISVEASRDDLTSLNTDFEKVIYGLIPVMTTEQCILKHYNKCKKASKSKATYEIQDRKNVEWNIETDCEACNMQILTDKPIYIRNIEELSKMNVNSFRLNFTKESGKDVKKVLEAYFAKGKLDIETTLGIYLKSVE